MPWKVGKDRDEQLERVRYLSQRCLVLIAYQHTTNFGDRLGHVLANLAQPAFESSCVGGRLCVRHRTDLPQRLNAFGWDPRA
jgi:hypothetical protein